MGEIPMKITVRAVYENGVLRPVEPLTLPEGETVAVTIDATGPARSAMQPPSPEEEDYARRLEAARSLDEMFAVMANAPGLPEGYDLRAALNANRKATGERLVFPDLDDESQP
jgi:predicted DNA-binding antitoxin AbrB/MazE fold protein